MEATATAPAPQHMRALAQANRVRLARAELKRQVAEGETSVAEVVLGLIACSFVTGEIIRNDGGRHLYPS